MATTIPHAQPSPRSESEPREPLANQSTRRTGKLLLMAALCSLLGYAGGSLHGTIRARSVAQGLEAELSESNGKLDSSQDQVASERSARTQLGTLIDLYEAYRASVQALSALDARNFGIAESHLRTSGDEVARAHGRDAAHEGAAELGGAAERDGGRRSGDAAVGLARTCRQAG